MQSKVSMVMPYFSKTREEIEGMLQSIHNQVWDNIELIIVNDGANEECRTILDEWTPKFAARGYDYIIIDQENQGISAAVRNGMISMTGDYFCSVDCDDWLYPEYVSTMAGWLEEHEDYDYTACGFERITGTEKNRRTQIANMDSNEELLSHKRIELLLLFRTEITSWIYLVRKSYLDKCRIIENFVTEPRLHQEPSISFALALGGGRLKHIPQVLYRHFLLNREMTIEEAEEKIANYVEAFSSVTRKVIEAFPIENEDYKKKLLFLCEFFKAKIILGKSGDFRGRSADKRGFAEQLADLVDFYFTPSPKASVEDILFTGFKLFFFALENALLEEAAPMIKEKLEELSVNRIIGYGVLGRAAEQLVQPLFKTKLAPSVFWDIASKGEVINGCPVEKPDFSGLQENDLLILMPSSASVWENIKPQLENSNLKYVIRHNELVQYLCEYYYPYFASRAYCYVEDKWRAKLQ